MAHCISAPFYKPKPYDRLPLTDMESSSPSIPSSDGSFFEIALLFMYLITPLTFLSLQFLQAPYGKHYRPGWGPSIPASIAWPAMECPTLFIPLLLFPYGQNASNPLAVALISFFLFHYFHRTCLYPFYLRPALSAPFPVSIALTAFAFNLLNAYLQSRWVSHYADLANAGWWFWRRFLIGSAVFLGGFVLNVRSDLALVRLKREAKGGYRVPRGGLFELVSCPNYLGEALEWLGWAVITWSWAGLAFFLYTCANLVPRARANRRWYMEKFGDEYPRSRKAIVPFLY
ncbi:hypothetical protein ACLOJK_030198 [Asimina triloba]